MYELFPVSPNMLLK